MKETTAITAAMSDDRPKPSEVGTVEDAPPIDEKPYKIIFEANKCFGAGKCAEASRNWELDLDTGVAKPRAYFLEESELDENIAAAEKCPAKERSRRYPYHRSRAGHRDRTRSSW